MNQKMKLSDHHINGLSFVEVGTDVDEMKLRWEV
jgi:hypothetical protein